MKNIRVTYTESIVRQADIQADSVESVRARLAAGDDELIERIEANSYECDGGGLTHDVIEYYTTVEEVS